MAAAIAQHLAGAVAAGYDAQALEGGRWVPSIAAPGL